MTATLGSGARIDRYEIESPIGSGAFGAVYAARHVMLQQRVALKVLHDAHTRNAETVERFLREARSAAALDHPNIAKVKDCGVTPDQQPFLAMELLDGCSLDNLLQREGRFTVDRAVTIVLQVLDALDAAHRSGIIHRDLKPANIFIAQSNHGEQVKLLDFGISKIHQPNQDIHLTQTGAILGTPAYMAPEQFWRSSEADHRADLYATAVVLYQLLSGQMPHQASTYEELLLRVCTTEPTPLHTLAPHVPPALRSCVERGLNRDPNLRFQSASEFSAALQTTDLVPVSPPVQFAPVPASGARASRKTSWLPWLAAIAGMLVMTSLTIGLVLMLHEPTRAPVAAPPSSEPVAHSPAPRASNPVVSPSHSPTPPTSNPVVSPSHSPTPPAPSVEPVVASTAPPTAPPISSSGPIIIHPLQTTGRVDDRALDELIARATPTVEGCRRYGGGARVQTNLFINSNGIGLYTASGSDPGSEDIAACVARAFYMARPQPWNVSPSAGIVVIRVTFP